MSINWTKIGQFVSKVSRMVVGGALVAAGAGLGVWVSLIVLDVLTAFWIYQMVVGTLVDLAVSEYPAKALAVVFTVFALSMLNGIFWMLIKRNHQKLVQRVAGLMLAWFAVMYVFASPYSNSLFNPWTGQARYKYVKIDGDIKKFPVGLKNDPDTNEPLKDFDTATAVEYYKLHPKPQADNRSLWNWLLDPAALGSGKSVAVKTDAVIETAESAENQNNLVMWVEKLDDGPDRSVAHFAVRRVDDEKRGLLYLASPSDRNIYLTDENGQTYDYRADNVTSDDGPNVYGRGAYRTIRVSEIYRFTMSFEPLKKGVQHLNFFSPEFHYLKLDRFLAKAE
ncbi:MAG: hypothetical protein ABI643_03585 [Candidatus Doudnabacteria bacterium]